MRIQEITSPAITYRFSDGPSTVRLVRDTVFPKRIKYFDINEASRENHFLASIGDAVVGMAGVEKSPYEKNRLWIKFISVDPSYQGQGIAKRLLRLVYEYAAKEGLKMAPGSFTDEGERLRHLHDVWDKEFPTVAYQRDAQGHYIDDDGKIMRMNEEVQWSDRTIGSDQIVWVDAEKLHASWKNDRYGYFDGEDHPNAIKGRIPRFNDWIKQGIPVNPPEVTLNDAGEIAFSNGRHRFTWMLQHGEKRVPVAVPPEHAREIERRFGVGVMVTESLDRNVPYRWVSETWQRAEAQFDVEGDRYFMVFKHKDFLSNDRDLYACEFYTEDQRIDVVGDRRSFLVMSTVLAIVREWVERNQPDALGFSAEGASRMRLYSALMSRIDQLPGYTTSRNMGATTSNFFLFKQA